MKKNCLVLFSLIFCALPLSAEVTSQACPHSCKTLGLDKSHCKDWKEGDTCFVDDMKPAAHTNNTENLERKVLMVNKTILAGQSLEVDLKTNNAIDHIDTVVKRNGGSTETTLSASLGSAINFGSQQVDQDKSHVVQFAANGTHSEGRKLKLSAANGDVFVESVHLLVR